MDTEIMKKYQKNYHIESEDWLDNLNSLRKNNVNY